MYSFSIRKIVTLAVIAFFSFSCNKENISTPVNIQSQLKSTTPKVFDWEIVDWMPTPHGQSKISVPWVGQGSLASYYDNDVLYDFKKSDGWELLYNSFDETASAPLKNPYFILYNKYRGLMRIYSYTTTEFVEPSSYIQDGISVVGSSSSMLNFCGKEFIDVEESVKTYSQIQPKPSEGPLPLASNKWHMLQYELAYDPNISHLNYNQIQLSWFTNYCNVDEIQLNGGISGDIKSAMGAGGQNNILSELGSTGKVLGTMGLSFIGSNVVDKYTVDYRDGWNEFYIPGESWKSLIKGVNSALSSSTSNLPGSIVNLFSAIIGGSSSQNTLNLVVDLDVELEGAKTSYGSFPSSPTSFYVPGSKIPSQAQNYKPLYNKKLGVFNLSAKPKLHIQRKIWRERYGNPRTGVHSRIRHKYHITRHNYKPLVVFNSDLTNIANIEIISDEVVFYVTNKTGASRIYSNANAEKRSMGIYSEAYINPTYLDFYNAGGEFIVTFKIRVTPKDGAPPVTIIKSFIPEFIYDDDISI